MRKALAIGTYLLLGICTLQSMDAAVSWDQERSSSPKGNLSPFYFKSSCLKNKREIWVYTPPGYSNKGERYPLLIVLDGQAYTSDLIPGPTILDNLIAEGEIPPMIAIFVSSIDQPRRNLELPCYKPFIESLSDELLPWVYKNYHASQRPEQVIIAGSSYGGLAAAYAALIKPDTFGKVLSQSGAFWWSPSKSGELWLIKQYEGMSKLPIEFYLDVGHLETEESGNRMSMVKVNALFSDLLKKKGYRVTHEIFQGGHDYACWRKTLAKGLIALAGKRQ